MPPGGRVCILHVGGTIGMVHSAMGLQPAPGFLGSHLASAPELAHPDVPPFELVVLEPLLDSADMVPQDWVRIAQAIVDRYDRYAGFVVLHGTDTMAFTASALSFLLPGLSKPVIVTGSQLPLGAVRSDGMQHVVTATILAGGGYRIPEVGLFFDARLMRGNRTQKVGASDFVGFRSANLPPLADAGVQIRINRHLIRPAGTGPPSDVGWTRTPSVVAVRITPGLSPRVLRQVMAAPADAVVLETYGAGNFPTRDPELLTVVRDAVDRGAVVVNCTQCQQGWVVQDLYSTGASLAAAGAIGAEDMTLEAALTKLYCLLGRGLTAAEVAERFAIDLAGELTPWGARQVTV
jgi:L-asparaginase